MRWCLVLISCMAAVNGAVADEIPKSIQDHLKAMGATASLSDSVLRATINKPVVSGEVFRHFTKSLCMPIWLADKGKDGWMGAKIDRLEAVNQIGKQGYAMPNARKACADLGKLADNASHDYINKAAWVCVAGNPCRIRREGEVTSGD